MMARTLADRWLRPDIARFICWFTLAVWLSLVVILFATTNEGNTAFGSNLGADFGEFYVVGQILNEGDNSRLYDLELQDRKLHDLFPKLAATEHLPFVYPPFLALIFQPLARLPFTVAVAAWAALSVVLYATAIGLAIRDCGTISKESARTSWLLALAFAPFAMECILGGQISPIGTLIVAAGWSLHRRGRPILAGAVLSILSYKPTLLILILPMLLISRSWKTLAGMSVGGLILAGVSWLVVGSSGCLDFIGLLAGYGRSGGSVGQGFKTMKYVDLTAFLRLLGLRANLCRPMALTLGLPILVGLMISWARTVGGRWTELTWASTLCLTPLLNIYGPIYDVAIVVPGILIGAHAIGRRGEGEWPVTLRWLLAFLFLSALITQPLALKFGFQPITLALLASGLYFLARSFREPGSDLAPAGLDRVQGG